MNGPSSATKGRLPVLPGRLRSRRLSVNHREVEILNMDINSLPVCVIGAGSSGIATAKALKERNVAFECFEIGSDIGGMWRYENDNGLSSAYRSLHIDTSRDNLGYSDFPIPRHYPDFMSHFEVIRYFESYVAHFKLRPHIKFNSEVKNVDREADSAWPVAL